MTFAVSGSAARGGSEVRRYRREDVCDIWSRSYRALSDGLGKGEALEGPPASAGLSAVFLSPTLATTLCGVVYGALHRGQ